MRHKTKYFNIGYRLLLATPASVCLPFSELLAKRYHPLQIQRDHLEMQRVVAQEVALTLATHYHHLAARVHQTVWR